MSLSNGVPFARAAEPATFTLEANSGPGNKVTVSVAGSNLRDLYAYELALNYDSLRLQWTGTSSSVEGYSVVPPSDKGRIVFAQTRLGKAEGVSGDKVLAEIHFERIRGGRAAVKLEQVKLMGTGAILPVKLQPSVEILLSSASSTLVMFGDIAGHWAKDVIERSSELGLANGYPDGTFRPQQSITRAEFAAMLGRALLIEALPTEQPRFADEEHMPDWALSHIQAIAQAGLMIGYNDNNFGGSRLITRQEMAAVLARALYWMREGSAEGAFEAASNAASLPANGGLDFKDQAAIEPWAIGYVQLAAGAGLIFGKKGKDGNDFVPVGLTTRAEAAAVLLRLLEAFV